MDAKTTRIAVVGAGSWGTALAYLLGDKGYGVDLWAYEPAVEQSIEKSRENQMFLPGIRLPETITPFNDLASVVSDKQIIVFVVPSHVMRDVSSQAAPHIDPDAFVVTASKGIENQTHLTMSGVLKETLPEGLAPRISVLSGPSFAAEVAQKMPTVVTVASAEQAAAAYIQNVFVTPYFRVYTNDDLIGVELGGAVKNVIAIASGIVDGLGLGLNTRAALITRGLVEIRRLGVKLGANPHTFAGLAGIGDLLLTCTGSLSRNHTVGRKIGEGKSLQEILAEMNMVAEGVKTSKSVYNLSRKLGVDMPISHSVYAVLYEDLSPKDGVYQLMTRDLKDEMLDVR
ncbi:MAG TPA: NAD(P)H-dependent glycerol-3-phosphate dehydrogenase [Desulfosalsimonadaceae bacterium]|nr:NAD(P)H-dependent glycerol-3-phosphate dehydrogenase [Desulfosalsimonadaceae bacterium]